MCQIYASWMANSTDHDQTTLLGAVYSEFTLFAQVFPSQCLGFLWKMVNVKLKIVLFTDI